MVSLGLEISYDEAKDRVLDNLENKKAYDKFLELVNAQSGDIYSLPKSSNQYEIKSMTEGYLVNIDAYKLGLLSMSLGAGRISKEDDIDYSAGVVIHKNINRRYYGIKNRYLNVIISKFFYKMFAFSFNRAKIIKYNFYLNTVCCFFFKHRIYFIPHFAFSNNKKFDKNIFFCFF